MGSLVNIVLKTIYYINSLVAKLRYDKIRTYFVKYDVVRCL